ncbi:MAG: hypothetical protein KDK30_15195, partial [Leptospiraceae bacterium]|nr:hypothetical protein [Leptospiraceae bacterium]
SFLRHAGFEDAETLGFPDTRIYPYRASRVETEEVRQRRQQLVQAREYFDQALELNIKDENARTNILFWMGWIDYVNSDFEKALLQWEQIDPLYSNSDPVLLMARGNAYFYTDQQRAALGNYLKVESDFEREVLEVASQDASTKEQRYYLLTLAAVYNNIGAIYEKEFLELKQRGGNPQELKELEKNALLYYYNAVDTAHRVGHDHEIARTNLNLAFKNGNDTEREPLIDDWISPVLYSLRNEL